MASTCSRTSRSFSTIPARGDQFEQADRRLISGGKIVYRRAGRWRGRPVQTTVGVQGRNDAVGTIGLYHTQRRARLETRSLDAVMATTAGAHAQTEVEWTPWFRTMTGVRADGARFAVTARDPLNSGSAAAVMVSPKADVMIGPWRRTEFYANAGTGFHSNDARGTTIVRDPDGAPAERVDPLVRAKGAEFGVRSVLVPHLQSTLSLWMLRLDSELVFAGDAGATEASRPSARRGVEWTNYYRAFPGVLIDADLSWSRARFTTFETSGQYIAESVGTVFSAGLSSEERRRVFGGIRWRYFGPRSLTDDDTVRSKPSSVVNLQAGCRMSKRARLALNVFNLFDVADSDIDYYYASRLPGEPSGGRFDIHTHPALPRTARLHVVLSF